MTPSELWGPSGPYNAYSKKTVKECVRMCGNACWFQSKWSHAEFILNIIHLLTCIFMTAFHGYSLHLWTLCARFHIHTRQTFCPPPSTFALLLVGRALQDRILQFQAQNGRHVSELSQGSRELHRPTNLLCIPSQNPLGWLSVNSTRGLGCFYIIHHIHSSPDVVISKGNLLWVIMLETDIKYASRITCFICCGCGLAMQREQVQKERKKWFWWGLIASLDQTLNLSCTQ